MDAAKVVQLQAFGDRRDELFVSEPMGHNRHSRVVTDLGIVGGGAVARDPTWRCQWAANVVRVGEEPRQGSATFDFSDAHEPTRNAQRTAVQSLATVVHPTPSTSYVRALASCDRALAFHLDVHLSSRMGLKVKVYHV